MVLVSQNSEKLKNFRGGNIFSLSNIVRRLKLSKLNKSSLLLVLAVVMMVFGVLVYLADDWKNDQPISTLNIRGLTYLPEAEIQAIIKPLIAGCADNDILLLKKFEKAVEKNPYVYKANFSREKACSLEVDIQERIPIAYYQHRDGSISYLDKKGKIIPFRHLNGYTDLPVFMSTARKIDKDSVIAKYASKIINTANHEEYSSFNYKISEIVYTDKDSSFYFRSISNKKKILFGRAILINQKLNTLDKYFKSELYKAILNEPYLVDIRWKDEVVLSHLR